VLEKYLKEVKLVEKNFPLQMHKLARPAAAAALAANAQGRFWEYHHKIFENMSSLSDAKFMDMARELNLDLDKFSKDMNSPAVQNLINRDLSEGNQARVSGTPSIFVNGKQLKDRSLQGFQNMIDAELKKKKQ
jgi:protein-disulfide isomerase